MERLMAARSNARASAPRSRRAAASLSPLIPNAHSKYSVLKPYILSGAENPNRSMLVSKT